MRPACDLPGLVDVKGFGGRRTQRGIDHFAFCSQPETAHDLYTGLFFINWRMPNAGHSPTDCQPDSERCRRKTLNEPPAGRAQLPVLIHLVGSAQRPKQTTKMAQITENTSEWFASI